MIRIMTLPNTEQFLSVVNHSRGDVFLHLPDHSRINLKNNPVAQQMIRLMKTGTEGLEIDLSDSADTISFIRYIGRWHMAG